MTYRIEVTRQAKKSLKDSYNYILMVSQSFEVADAWLSKIETAIQTLSYYPYSSPQEDSLVKGIRKKVVNTYNIFYEVIEEKRAILIVDVLHGKMVKTLLS